jgi:hypothetical protein
VLLYLASVGLVAAAIIVLFSVASFSLLGTSKETLTGSRIDNNPIEDVSINTVVLHGSNTAPVPVPTKLPSSSEANNLPSATLVPPPSGISGEQTSVEPALNPLPHGETSARAVETPHGSTVGPSTDEAPPPEPSGSQQMTAQPLSITAETGAAAVEVPLASTVRPSTDEAPPAEPIGSQQVIAQHLSIADEASAAQHASGATMPWVATSDGEPDQKSQNFRKIQRNHHANLGEGSATFTLENRFPENQVKESMRFHGSAASAGSDPPLLRAASRGRRAIKANRGEIADRLNHAELSHLIAGGRASHRAPRR